MVEASAHSKRRNRRLDAEGTCGLALRSAAPTRCSILLKHWGEKVLDLLALAPSCSRLFGGTRPQEADQFQTKGMLPVPATAIQLFVKAQLTALLAEGSEPFAFCISFSRYSVGCLRTAISAAYKQTLLSALVHGVHIALVPLTNYLRDPIRFVDLAWRTERDVLL